MSSLWRKMLPWHEPVGRKPVMAVDHFGLVQLAPIWSAVPTDD